MLILASASPRRLSLLQQIGITPGLVVPADIDESQKKDEKPSDYARRIAFEKASAVRALYPGDYVLAADTVVAIGRRILPKAESAQTARECLQILSGRRHRVLGGVCLMHPDGKINQDVIVTRLCFKRLSKPEIENYISKKEWDGKAGGYAIQGQAAQFIPWINGCYNNVVGLPTSIVYSWLKPLGFCNGE